MKICVATTKGGLDDQVSPVFGRCQTFTFVEVEGKEIKNTEVVQNQFAGAMGGAGIQAAQLVVNKGVQAVIAGNFGPNAFPILSQGGAKVISIQGITVKDAVMKYLSGELSSTQQPTSPLFAGSGMGMGGGSGMGAGMGRGGGRGMGMGRGMGVSTQVPPTVTPPQTKEQERQMLENQVKQLENQIGEIKKRLAELKNKKGGE